MAPRHTYAERPRPMRDQGTLLGNARDCLIGGRGAQRSGNLYSHASWSLIPRF